MIQSIVHIALVVKDYDEAIEFYTKKLNFELVEDIYQPEHKLGNKIKIKNICKIKGKLSLVSN